MTTTRDYCSTGVREAKQKKLMLVGRTDALADTSEPSARTHECNDSLSV